MRLLVTGASGFVGSTLCDELTKRGHEVKVLVRKNSPRGNLEKAKVTPVEGDLRRPESLEKAVEGVDTVFHVAGVVAARTREDFFASNAEGTKNLALACMVANPNLRRFVYVSSLAAAGPSNPERPRVEAEEDKPVSWYGESKLEGEKILRTMKLPSVVIRPPAVYGPRDKGVFTFFETISKGVLPVLGMQNPDPRRYSFVHVDDLVQGIVLAGFSEKKFAPAEVFYISGEGEYSWENSMEIMAQAMEKKTLRVRLPIPVLGAAAAFCSAISKTTGKVLPLSLDKLKELSAPAWSCSNKKAKEQLGFSPYWGLKEGFKQTADWYRLQGWIR